MNVYLKSFFSTLVFLLFSVFVFAQPQEYVIKGRVLENSSKQPLGYANVAIYSVEKSALVTGTITDDDGDFSLTVKKAGKYYLEIQFLGYKKKRVDEVDLKASKNINIGTVLLSPDEIAIAEVGVVAEKPMMRYEVDRKVIDVSHNPMAQGGSAVEALENVPSISVDMEGSVSLRGSSNFTVLIDGRQSPLSGSDALNQIPANAIAEIEIITNPSAKYDPDGTGGIINIITKKGRLKGHSFIANLSAGTSPMLSGDFSYTYRHKKYEWMLSAGYKNADVSFYHQDDQYMKVYDSVADGYYDSNVFTDKEGNMIHGRSSVKTAVDLFLSDNNTLNIGGGFYSYHFARKFTSLIEIHQKPFNLAQIDSLEKSVLGFDVSPKRFQINVGDRHIFKGNQKHYFSADFLYKSGDEFSNDFSTKYGDWNSEILLADDRSETEEKSDEMRLELNYAQPFSGGYMLETGFTFRNKSYTHQYSRFEETETDSWLELPELRDQADFNRNIYAGWAVFKGKTRYFDYSFGLRVEHTDRKIKTEKDNWDFKYNYLGWYPSVSLMRKWDKGHSLQASYSKRLDRPRDHHMNPFPSLSDGYFIYVPNPELKPEIASSFELNYQKEWKQNFVAVESFYRYVKDEIDRVSEVRNDTLTRTIINIGSVSDAGLEATANVKMLKWWGWNINASGSYHIIEDESIDSGSDKGSFEFRSSATATFDILKKWKLQAMVFYRGPREKIDASREHMYWFSAAIRRDLFDRKLTVSLRGDDLFSTRRREEEQIAENLSLYRSGHRQSPLFVFALSYKFNSNPDRKGRRGSENGDDGMMDF